ncbi:MAG: hypothetical protein PPP58_10150 [Natronomonas sp.]
MTGGAIAEGLKILRHDGPLEALRAGLRFCNLNYQGYYYYLRREYRIRRDRSIGRTDPFTVLWVDPRRITAVPETLWYRWTHFGETRDGEWDRTDRTVDDLIKYRSVVDRFENDRPWEETAVYREAMKRVRSGGTYWNGCRTAADVRRRAEHVEELYERIDEHGYRSQEQLRGESLREITLSRTFDRSQEEVAVAVGRNGEFLFVDGNHRLAIAHVIGIEEIPVHVVTRHAEWESIRRRIDAGSAPRAEVDAYGDHPDIPTSIFDSDVP